MNTFKIIRSIKYKRTLSILLLLVILVFIGSTMACTTYGGKMSGERLEKITKSKQYSNGRFHNTYVRNGTMNSFTGVLGKWIFGSEVRSPENKLPIYEFDFSILENRSPDSLKVTWNGHSSTIIQIDGKLILTDPVYSEAAGPYPIVSPKRFHEESPINADSLPDIDLVIISHNHYDHLDKKTVLKLVGKVEKFVMPLGVGAYLENWGIPPNKIVELDWYENIEIAPNLIITATPSQHFSNRFLNDRNETLWASWVIAGKQHRIFFSGDSGYSPDFKSIGEEYGPFDLTMLEMGAYGEYWPDIHMTPEEAVRAHLDLKGNILHPIHWGTFQLSFSSWTEPIERLLKAAGKHSIVVATPIAGETTVLDKHIPQSKWWRDSVSLQNQDNE